MATGIKPLRTRWLWPLFPLLLVLASCGASSRTGSAQANEWTWVNGASISNQQGIYGSQGTSAPGNVPGARSYAVSWTDSAGNFWLFGGLGRDSTAAFGELNDLWKYSAGQWTWMGGSNMTYQIGSYGSQGVSAPSNVPGARSLATSWTDTAGSFWLFGGFASSSTAPLGQLNDLWKYSAGQWTWIGGSNTTNQSGTYGAQGTAAPTNVPGAREAAIAWTDTSGNFWLFGGVGPVPPARLNDLWKYSPSAGQWTWIAGSNISNQTGTYGTLGIPDAANSPGARSGSIRWTDAAGNFWLFGGTGYDSLGPGLLNDLWKYTIGTGEWTWMGGSNVGNQSGTYGTLGVRAATNVPGARSGGIGWVDASGNFWLFGGGGYDSMGTLNFLNDLWKYSAGQWTWMGGSNIAYQSGSYGTEGVTAGSNVPGARGGAIPWRDATGSLWLFGGDDHDLIAPTIDDLNDLWKYQP
jgi:hypothetical protein